MVTSKGMEKGVRKPFRLSSFLPYAGLMLLTLLSSWFYMIRWNESSAQGLLIFTIQNCLVLITIFAVILINDMREMAAVKVKIPKIILLRFFPHFSNDFRELHHNSYSMAVHTKNRRGHLLGRCTKYCST